jgi:hypothetical protein
VHRVLRDVITEECTWRVLCEDLYKVCSYPIIFSLLPGSRLYSGSSPLLFYPLIFTVDTRSVRTCIPERLLHEESVCSHRLSVDSRSTSRSIQLLQEKAPSKRHVRVLVRPGRYGIPQAVTVHATRRTTRRNSPKPSYRTRA